MVSVPDGQSLQVSCPHTHSVVDRSGRPSHRSHTPCMTGSRCHARSRNISRCLSTGTASAHLLDVLRRSAGCQRRPPAPGGKKGAGGSALTPGTSPEPTAQGVYVNTPRRYAGLRRRQAACVQFGHAYHAGLFREAGRLSSRSRKGKESDGSKPHGRDPHIPRCIHAAPGPVPMHPRSTRASPDASPQHTGFAAQLLGIGPMIPRRPSAAPSSAFPRGENFLREGGPAVNRGRVKTFFTPGRVCKDPRTTHHASHASAQGWHRFAPQRRLFSVRFCHNSLAVLRL